MTYREAIDTAARKYLEWVLAESGGCVAAAAQIADLNRTYFYHAAKRVGVTLPTKRVGDLGNRGRWAEAGL